MDKLKNQLSAFYSTFYKDDMEKNKEYTFIKESIYSEMDKYKAENPNISAVSLKSELHSKIAEYFVPVIFDELPFFYEMAIRPTWNWGFPEMGLISTWGLPEEIDNAHNLDPDIKSINVEDNALCFSTGKVFDTDHHCIGYSTLFEIGISGILRNIEAEKKISKTNTDKYEFLSAAETSCKAVIKIANKFADKAEQLLKDCTCERKKNNLRKIRDTARKVPQNPPESFYEGLCMIWFLREVTASIEGVGISVLGRVDKLLGELYKNDIKNGTISQDEAKTLIKMWLTPTHVRFKAEIDGWADSSTVIELGGCDKDGKPIFNDVTRFIIEAHEELNYVIPKINCRIAKNSPKEYIGLISTSILKGRNVYSILNDDAIIEALVNNGKSLVDARNYVNGGCQETMVEGMEHSAGALIYFNTPKLMESSLVGVKDEIRAVITANALAQAPRKIENPKTFEEFYNAFVENVKKAIKCSVDFRLKYGKKWREVHPCPFFSSTLSGCIENGKDYTAGGAKYNPSTICLSGLGTVTDSLYAIKKAIFEDKTVSYEDLVNAIAEDWESNPDLKNKMIALPKYGHGELEVDEIAARLINELNEYVKTLDNERDDKFILSEFVYNYYSAAGAFVGATPDGRKAGSYYSQGVTAGRLKTPESVLNTFHSVNTVNFRKTGGVSVIDINLPVNKNMNTNIISAIINTFISGNCHALQLNYVSREELKKAQKNPDDYRDLIVRMCGFSAYFVNLSFDNQQEFITRNFYTN